MFTRHDASQTAEFPRSLEKRADAKANAPMPGQRLAESLAAASSFTAAASSIFADTHTERERERERERDRERASTERVETYQQKRLRVSLRESVCD